MIVAFDWVAASSIATAGATLVLALATFGSVRSANRAARAAERSLLAGLRPVLMPSRPEDPPLRVGFMDDKWFMVPGSSAIAEAAEDALYLAMSLRNVGSGIAVIHGWHLSPRSPERRTDHSALEDFHLLSRDLYIAPGEVAFWQGALRDPSSDEFVTTRDAIQARTRLWIEVLYGDHELGQRSISGFLVTPQDGGSWLLSVARHWNVDRPDPR